MKTERERDREEEIKKLLRQPVLVVFPTTEQENIFIRHSCRDFHFFIFFFEPSLSPSILEIESQDTLRRISQHPQDNFHASEVNFEATPSWSLLLPSAVISLYHLSVVFRSTSPKDEK